MRSPTAMRRRPTEAAAIEAPTDERFPGSARVSWAWEDLNLRPHPYQVSPPERRASQHFPRPDGSVGALGMG